MNIIAARARYQRGVSPSGDYCALAHSKRSALAAKQILLREQRRHSSTLETRHMSNCLATFSGLHARAYICAHQQRAAACAVMLGVVSWRVELAYHHLRLSGEQWRRAIGSLCLSTYLRSILLNAIKPLPNHAFSAPCR